MSQGRAHKLAHAPIEDGGNSPSPRECRRCGASLAGLDYRSEFCGKTCRDRWWQQARVRGGAAYALLVEWRTTRGRRKGVLADLAHLVDGWLAEDKENDRR